MHEDNQHASQTGGRSTQHADKRAAISSRFEQFERRQKELWRFTFAVLFALAIFFAWTSWASIRSIASRYEALPPVLLVVVIALFGIYMSKKSQEISELRGLMRGMEHRDEAPPSDKQLDQLFSLISKSQQGYRDLIDSFDDVLLALSLDGQVRAANRSFSDLVGTPFQEIIGKPLTDFLQGGGGDGAELVRRAMPRFMERRQWSGVAEVHLEGQGELFYFDCVAHAMLRDGEVHGITVLARDVSALRKNETRFTELFESLQEGIYITTPDGAIVDANPALVRMLGYDSKEELLKKKVSEIFIDRAERKIAKEQVESQPKIQGREITLVRKDGTSIVCLNTAAVVRYNSGRNLRTVSLTASLTSSSCSTPTRTIPLSALAARRFSVTKWMRRTRWSLVDALIRKICPPCWRSTSTSSTGGRLSHHWKFACATNRETGAGFVSISVLYPTKRGILRGWFSPAVTLPISSVSRSSSSRRKSSRPWVRCSPASPTS